MDFESYQDGILLYTGPKEGEAVPVDAIIAVLGEKGEDYKALLEDSKKEDTASDKKEAPEASSNSKEADSDSSDSDSDVTAEDLGVTVITMPLLSDTMTEGVIAEWNFKVGDEIKSEIGRAHV